MKSKIFFFVYALFLCFVSSAQELAISGALMKKSQADDWVSQILENNQHNILTVQKPAGNNQRIIAQVYFLGDPIDTTYFSYPNMESGSEYPYVNFNWPYDYPPNYQFRHMQPGPISDFDYNDYNEYSMPYCDHVHAGFSYLVNSTLSTPNYKICESEHKFHNSNSQIDSVNYDYSASPYLGAHTYTATKFEYDAQDRLKIIKKFESINDTLYNLYRTNLISYDNNGLIFWDSTVNYDNATGINTYQIKKFHYNIDLLPDTSFYYFNNISSPYYAFSTLTYDSIARIVKARFFTNINDSTADIFAYNFGYTNGVDYATSIEHFTHSMINPYPPVRDLIIKHPRGDGKPDTIAQYSEYGNQTTIISTSVFVYNVAGNPQIIYHHNRSDSAVLGYTKFFYDKFNELEGDPLDIATVDRNVNLVCFPNPFENSFSIQCPDKNTYLSLHVFSSDGKQILDLKGAVTLLNLKLKSETEKLNRGLYFVEMIDVKGYSQIFKLNKL